MTFEMYNLIGILVFFFYKGVNGEIKVGNYSRYYYMKKCMKFF